MLVSFAPCRSKCRSSGLAAIFRIEAIISQCRGLIFPGEEDFGMVPVEAMASGRPVVAYARAAPSKRSSMGDGVFFNEQTVER